MSKFNTRSAVVLPRSVRGSTPLQTSAVADARTREGGLGFSKTAQTELFQLLTGSFVAEDGFYESADARMARVRSLVETIVADDASENRVASGVWFAGFARWLRTEAFIRTGAVALAAEAVRARLVAGAAGLNRDIVSGALDRADEPGELIGYWLTNFGKPIPTAVKRGISDAIVRLYTEHSTLRYDTDSHAIRFGDVVELVGPRTNARPSAGSLNHALLRHLIDRRHSYNTNDIPESLSMLRARAELMAVPVAERRGLLASPERLKAAGMSWESLAGWLQGPMDAGAWEAVIASGMGYMAMLRNLRNFDESGVSAATARKVAERLADPDQVAKSRQFPFRFLSAYREVSSDRYSAALSDALDASTANVPALPGRTLILVDTSASMGSMGISSRSKVRPVDIAALFGITLGMRCGPGNVSLHGFADSLDTAFGLKKGGSVLKQMDGFASRIGRVGHGTEIELAVKTGFAGHDRVVLFSDMQTFGSHYEGRASALVPAHVPFYAFDLGGYSTGVVGAGTNRFQLGGFSDKTFSWMETIEKMGRAAKWPWESDKA